MRHDDFEEELVKQRILSRNNTFKTAFKATLGFYAAQTLVTFFGLGTIGLTIFVLYKLFN